MSPDERAPTTGGDLDARLAAVRHRIVEAGGQLDRITICAVTKGFGADAVRAAVAAGLRDIGENYAQELVAKAGELAGDAATAQIRWHMIGGVQRNKVRTLGHLVGLWQTVDRDELGVEIAKRSPGAAVLVQVNATGEAGKSGIAPADAPALVDALVARGLDVRGLMTVGPTDPDTDPRPAFDRVARLAADLGLAELSMGMSADLEAAVAAGSTMVRVGTALFGPRPTGATVR
jgi:PLP dependent protein